MKNLLKRNIFIVIAISIVLVLFDIFTDWQKIGMIGLAFIFIILSIFITNRIINGIILTMGIFLLILSILMIDSIWVLILSIVLLLILFRTDQGNEFFHLREALIRPSNQGNIYEGVKLIEPQSENRVLLDKQSIFDVYQAENEYYNWDDVNIVYFGGGNIVDLGNTIIPEGETNIIIRKFYGRTRIILPHDVGLRINYSVISGALNFESQRYDLTGENFKWVSPAYSEANRKINLVISVAFGDVEVIIT